VKRNTAASKRFFNEYRSPNTNGCPSHVLAVLPVSDKPVLANRVILNYRHAPFFGQTG
jgi:hypothetical protein